MLLRVASVLALLSLSGCGEVEVLLYMGHVRTEISGRVADADGAPVEGATVTLAEDWERAFPPEEDSTTTAKDGRYSVVVNHGAGPSHDKPVRLSVAKEGFSEHIEFVTSGTSLHHHEIQLVPE